MSHLSLKIAALASLFCSGLLSAESESHSFPLVIEGTKCQITAYQPAAPIVWTPLLTKESIPESPLLRVIMLTNSDLSSLLSDEEVSKLLKTTPDRERLQKMREGAKKMYDPTGSSAAENPWKGMKYALTAAFVIESERGKFLFYQIASVDREYGTFSSQLKNISGKWLQNGDEKDPAQSFKISDLANIPKEFTKQKESVGLQALPLETLLK
ncbi:MAG: hypothetical protein ABI600_19630 [Luteolibacter sp.]